MLIFIDLMLYLQSLSDKSKLKATRNVDNAATVVKSNQLSGSLQSVHRTSSTKLDMQKHSSQGKLLVLKPSKDVSVMTAKPEGNNGNAIMSTSVTVSAAHSISQLKKPNDVRETSQQPGLSAVRVKDSWIKIRDPPYKLKIEVNFSTPSERNRL